MITPISVAIAGNPNCGKTTLFNVLTGSRQHVGNWPGKTVERRSATVQHRDRAIDIVDLPGAYSLTATSPEETIARDALVEGRPDVVVVVIDAAHLERNLYLATQILELGANAVLALNMTDVADAEGIVLDVAALEARTGVPVVPLVARTGAGVEAVLDAVVDRATKAAA